MKRVHCLVIMSVFVLTGAFILHGTGSAAVPSVQLNGNTYYAVNGNNPAMDTGDEVCKSMNMKCVGYKSVNTNAICKLFHPTAKELVSVNGSKAGFYCNGAPQQGLACAKMKNTCEVCPACNLNEAETCSQPIGQHFAEMYVWCEPNAPTGQNSTKGPPKLPVVNKSSVRSIAASSVRSMPPGQDPRIGTYPGKVICEFYQMTNPGDYAKSNKKLATCAAYKAADHYCTIAMQSQYARAERCDEHGIIICSNPCSPPAYQVPISNCAFDNDRPRGSQAPPLKFCGSSSKAASIATKKSAGQACQHGGECQSGMCLGVVPGQHYVCSCIDPTTRWQSCIK